MRERGTHDLLRLRLGQGVDEVLRGRLPALEHVDEDPRVDLAREPLVARRGWVEEGQVHAVLAREVHEHALLARAHAFWET